MPASLETYRGVAHPWLCDSMGHMNTRHYAAMFDDASFHLLGVLGGLTALANDGFGWADVRHLHEFKHEVESGALIVIRSTLTRIGTKSITYRHEMRGVEADLLHATSEIVSVQFDLRKRAAVALLVPVRARAQALLDAASERPAR
jgi:acyl-CoA thioester hydrolase